MKRRLFVAILLVAVTGHAAPAGAAAGGSILVVERHTTTVRVRAESARSVVVRCPKGTQVSGGGFNMDGYAGVPGTRVLASRPFDSDDRDRIPDDGWSLTGYNDQRSARDLTAWAICAANSNFTYHSTTTAAPPDVTTSGVVLCDGLERVIGGGASISLRNSRVGLGVTTPIDWTDADGTTDDGWTANMANESRDRARFSVFAVCDADNLYTYPTQTVSVPSPGGLSPVATCASGPVTGGGLSHPGDPFPVVTGVSGPVNPPPSHSWTVAVWNFGGSTIPLTSTAICLVQ